MKTKNNPTLYAITMIEKTKLQMLKLGIEGEIIKHPETDGTHSEVIAKALNIPLDHIIKCLILRSKRGKLVSAIILGNQSLDFKKLEEISHMKKFSLASKKLVQEKIGFPIGGVPPIAAIDKIPIFVDEKVMSKNFIIGSAGTPFHGLKLIPSIFKKFNITISDIHKH
ncbi:MAG: YbaK/EbsC family protein [Promethearchaeota archaeon]|nr:MAG: YbaK/EbsC family protein [Candidatus Lokiarchaeota archaeon]